MDLKDLIRLVSREVIRQLSSPPAQEVLVLLTGGRSAWPHVKFKLAELKERGVILKPFLSDAARQLFDLREIQDVCGPVAEEDGHGLWTAVQNSALVLLPTLTVNTAAKLASGIQDTKITLLAGWALMLGKPVIAVTNGADPGSSQYLGLGITQAQSQYKERLSNNLKALESFGVEMVEAEGLLPAVSGVLSGTCPDRDKTVRVKGVLTRAKVEEAARQGYHRIIAPTGAVTPLAWETAVSAGLEICQE